MHEVPERRANCALHEQRIDRIEADIKEFRIEAREDRQNIKDQLSKIIKILSGNGSIGLCGQVKILWAIGVVVCSRLLFLLFRFIEIGIK